MQEIKEQQPQRSGRVDLCRAVRRREEKMKGELCVSVAGKSDKEFPEILH